MVGVYNKRASFDWISKERKQPKRGYSAAICRQRRWTFTQNYNRPRRDYSNTHLRRGVSVCVKRHIHAPPPPPPQHKNTNIQKYKYKNHKTYRT